MRDSIGSTVHRAARAEHRGQSHHHTPRHHEEKTVSALEFRNVDILFPPAGSARRRASAAVKGALASLDSGGSRTEIAGRTGVIVGVCHANLAIERGQISVLMGLSGSGKSTLLRAANGLNRVTRGEVLVRDGGTVVDIARCDAATLRRVRRLRIAMVFQQFALLPWRTVRENVGFGLELRGSRPKAAAASSMSSSSSSGSPSGPTVTAASSPAACSSVSGWRAHSPPTPRSC